MSFFRFKFPSIWYVLALIAIGCLPEFTGNTILAAPDRITQPVNPAVTRVIGGNVNRQARAQFDQGLADPSLPLDHVMLLLKPSAAQQADLDQLLAAQQNPASGQFHKWLTPEQFAGRFGVSASDHSKVVAWLQSQGLTVNQSARGRNWIAFSGTTGQVARALKTEFHLYRVRGATHFANATAPSVPEALAGVVNGFLGLDDFRPQSMVRKFIPAASDPGYTQGTSHSLVPQDWVNIYDVAPLYQAGIDGTGQSIAIVGQTDLLMSDISSFRARYGLPPKNPTVILYGTDPGVSPGDLVEADLDLEWSGAIAPNANIYYVNSTNVFVSAIVAVDGNVAPVISMSYGSCEVDAPVSYLQPVAQQANAQGITILNASGDSGAAGCDDFDDYPYYATLGEVATFPANIPEVTGVGGTEFNEGNGNYWSATNSSDYGSALGYIPEMAWNDTSLLYGIAAGAGGVSQLVPKPAWQAGPGVPNDNARDIPDIAMDAALHDPYTITYQGALLYVGGTSAPTPSFAGVMAMLNQYQVMQGFQTKAGLGNINPQLYHLAQSAPSVFHDVTTGSNIVPCAQGTLDCLTGSYGYSATTGYDPVTGLGSIDVNNFVTQWNTATTPVTVTLSLSPSSANVNQNIQVTATVVAASGSGTPTGTVSFEAAGIPLGSATLAPVSGVPTASLAFAASVLGPGAGFVDAVYSGDASFNSGSAAFRLRISTPVGASAILLSVNPNPVYAAPPDAQGPSWQAIVSLQEIAGVPSMLTGFTINGQTQSLAQYFPSISIPANGTLTANIVLRNVQTPSNQVFAFTGIDSAGNTWSRHMTVNFLGPQVFPNFNFSAVPLTMTPNPETTSTPCQYSQLLTLDETGGFQFQITDLTMGSVDIANQIPAIFGTNVLGSYASLRGTLCWNGITPPATNTVTITLLDTLGDVDQAEITVSFAGPVSNPATLSATPTSVTLQQASATVAVGITDKTQSWSAAVYPANRETSWLQLSQYSGTGPGNITLTASGAGFEPGVYRANIVLQSQNTFPQTLTVPVMFVNGPSGGSSISGVTNALSYAQAASPGMILAVFGTQLSTSTASASTQPLPYTMGGVTATVNGVGAPLYFVSSGQLNIQVPYEAGAGPAVIGINNNGQIAGLQFEISPSAPGILTDGNGNVNPVVTAHPGSEVVLYETGDGVVSPALPDGFSPAAGTSLANLPTPILPFTVTVGGVPAFLDFVGIVPGVIGLTQVNFIVPASLSAGVQPVVVTVNGVSSLPANITVTAAQ